MLSVSLLIYCSTMLHELLSWSYLYVTQAAPNSGITLLPRFSAGPSSSPPFEPLYDEFGRLVEGNASGETVVERHSTFLCCVQSICYVLCFYGLDMAGTLKDEGSKQQWGCVLTCSMSPLRHCAPSIRGEFCRLLKQAQLMAPDLLELMPVESRSGLSAANHSKQDLTAFYRLGSNSTKHNVLESFFPFDPCLLSGLQQSIEAHYRDWKGLPGIDLAQSVAFEADETNSEDDEEEDSIVSSMVSMSVQSSSEPAVGSVAMSSGSEVSYWGHSIHESVVDSSTMQKEWKPNSRRPRQYSVGSTGSW